MRRQTWIVLLAAAAALPAGRAPAEDANVAFESLYGANVKKALATPDAKDDIELAGRLLAAAKETLSRPDLVTLLCEKAHDLAAKTATGRPTALFAMQLLMENVPEKEPEARLKRIALCQAAFATKSGTERQALGEKIIDLRMEAAEERAAAGDYSAAADQARRALGMAELINSPLKEDVRQCAADMALRERLEKQIAGLKTRLDADANLTFVREQLIRLLLVDMDRPAEAAKFVDAGVADQALRTYVPLAAQKTETVAEAACLELGEWYRGLGEKAAPYAKPDLYERAKGYYQAYLDKHPADDLARGKAKASLEAISAILVKLATADSRAWADVLRLVDVSKNTSGGKWERKEQGLAVTAAEASRATVPLVPGGSYELLVQFVRKDGNGPVAILLPTGSSRVTLMLGWNEGEVSGLHRVDGKGCWENATAVRPGTLVNGKEYAVEARVILRGKSLSVSVDLNGQKCIRWEGTESALAAGLWGMPPGPKALGLAANGAEVTFLAARLHVLSGETRILQPQGDNPDLRILPPGARPGGWGGWGGGLGGGRRGGR